MRPLPFLEAGAEGCAGCAGGGHDGALDLDGSDRARVRQSAAAIVDDYSDDTDTTGTVAVGGKASGEINYRNDSDWFAVTLEAGKTYEITRSGTKDGAETSLILGSIFDDEGEFIDGTHCLPGEATKPKRFTPDEDGTCYVSVSSYSSAPVPGLLGAYTLSVDEVDAL